MRIEPRVLLLAGILLATVPSWAGACEQKLDASATATACSMTMSATARCSPTAAKATSTTCSVVIAKSSATSRATKKTRRHWSPGHLIEPDSMRLVPGERTPGEQWVIISSRTGTIQVHRTPWAPKKSESHNSSQTARHS